MRGWVKHKLPRVRTDRELLRDYVLIMANTGLRNGEARNLKWRDIEEIKQKVTSTPSGR